MTITHHHCPSKELWNRKIGAQNAGAGEGFAGLPRLGHNCHVTGAHVIVDLCRCGTAKIYCPERGSRWVGGVYNYAD